ncbi:hypothetical protein CapIbe_002244, partial [Capra ibex]
GPAGTRSHRSQPAAPPRFLGPQGPRPPRRSLRRRQHRRSLVLSQPAHARLVTRRRRCRRRRRRLRSQPPARLPLAGPRPSLPLARAHREPARHLRPRALSRARASERSRETRPGPTAWCGREGAESGRGRGPEALVVAADESKKGRRRGKGEPASLHRQEVRLAAGPFTASSQAPAERRSKVAPGGAAPRQLKSSAHAQTRLASEADRPAPQTRPRLQHPAADRTA